MQNLRVICRDWVGMALDRIAVGAGERVIYISNSADGTEISTGTEPVGFPKEDVFEYADGMAGRHLKPTEWAKLKPLVC
jgi:hypothetical protein